MKRELQLVEPEPLRPTATEPWYRHVLAVIGVTAKASLLVVAIMLVVQTVASERFPAPDELLRTVVGFVGMLGLPLAAIAGGARGATRGSRAGLVLVGLCVVGAVGYVVETRWATYLDHQARVASHRARGNETNYPFGPLYPSATRAQLEAVRRSPHPDPFPSVSDHLRHPANFVVKRIHDPWMFATLTVVNGLIGFYLGLLTQGQRSARRAQILWGAGVASGLAVVVLGQRYTTWVVRDPSHSGVLGAWGPILVPLAALFVLVIVWRHRLEPD